MKFLLIFIFGTLVGSIFDGFHTHSQTTAYTNPWILKMAIWVPPLFGSAMLGIITYHTMMNRWFKLKTPPPLTGGGWGEGENWKKITAGFFLFAIQYASSGFIKLESLPALLLQLLLTGFIWFLFDKKLIGILLAIPVAIAGSLVEIFLIRSGGFYYLKPDFLGIPFWLPCLYLSASIVVGNLAKKISSSTITP